ncbi:MAG: lysophospholipid acyltransferase family protein [Rhodobacteraceae bacterium]|nr:lysophospholipid acyltransferase family protein [Paracoccaceae bacterium]
MISRSFISLWHHIRYAPLFAAITSSKGRRFDRRARALGAIFGFGIRMYPFARHKFNKEIMRVFPDISRVERRKLRKNMGRNMGQTLFEIYHGKEFQNFYKEINVAGPGLATLEQARKNGKGAIIVSGHFGQWEAIRTVLKERGMETGAVYRRQKNRHYQRRLLAGIESVGKPIMASDTNGTRNLVRHLRNGGFVAILLDEKSADGVRLPFLGHEALTSVSAARLALKFDVPMVPAYGTRIGEGSEFQVDFEAEIPPTDTLTMTQAFNDSLSKRILADPEQWYWMLRRWKGA